MVREWVQEHVEPQVYEHDRLERFNLDLKGSMGELGLFGPPTRPMVPTSTP